MICLYYPEAIDLSQIYLIQLMSLKFNDFLNVLDGAVSVDQIEQIILWFDKKTGN